MLGLLLIFKAITVLMTLKITKMALMNICLNIGGVEIRVRGKTMYSKIFSLRPRVTLRASLFVYNDGEERRQLY